MDETLLRKLNYKEGDKALIMNAPAEYIMHLDNIEPDTKPTKKAYNFIQVFLFKRDQITEVFREVADRLAIDGKLWFCYAKKGSKIQTDISRDKGWEVADEHKFVPVRQVAIDDTWSALRFKPADSVKNMQRQNVLREFTAEIISAGGGAFVKIPYDMEKTYGTKGQVKVKATFDGHEYRGSIANMGEGHILIVRKDVRQAIGKEIGDTVKVIIEKDIVPREIEIPHSLQRALKENPFCLEFFNSLSFTNRKEYATWVGSAKRPETQQKRLDKTIENLKAGIKNPFQK